MDREGEAKAAPPHSATTPSHLRWDTEGLRTHRCAIATATATPQEVILNFGGRVPRDQPGEVGATLLRRIALKPLTAKQLSSMVQRLITDHDNRQR